MKGFLVLISCLSNHLKGEDVGTAEDCVLNGRSVCQELHESLSNDGRIVIDVESTCRGNTSDEISTFDFLTAVKGDFEVVVYILLNDLLDEVLLQLEPCTVLPLLTDFLILVHITIIKADHDTVRIQLNYFQRGTLGSKVVSQFKQSKLTCDAHRSSHLRVKKVVVFVEHGTIGCITYQFESVCGLLVSCFLGDHSAFKHIRIFLRIANRSTTVAVNRNKVRIIASDILISDSTGLRCFFLICGYGTVNAAEPDLTFTVTDVEDKLFSFDFAPTWGLTAEQLNVAD